MSDFGFVKRIAYEKDKWRAFILKNKADVDDIVQETFYKYMTTDLIFENENHY